MAYGIGPGSTIWYDLEGFDLTNTACRESALVFTSAWVSRIKAHGYVAGFYSSASSGIKMLDDARTPASRPVRAAGPDLDRPVGRQRRHLDDVHPRGRLASRWPDEAVPRRPQRDVGRRHDQHRQQLHRPRRRLGARARGPLPRHPPRLLEVPDPHADLGAADPGQGAAVPAHRAGHLLGSGQRVVRRRDGRGCAGVAGEPAVHADATPSRSGTGPRCCPRARARSSSAARSTSRSTGCSARSTPRAPAGSGRAASSTPRPRPRSAPTSRGCASRSPAWRRRRPGTSSSRAK